MCSGHHWPSTESMTVTEKEYFTCLMNTGLLPLEIEALPVSKDPLSCELEIQGNKMEQVKKRKYLGTETTSNGSLQLEVQHEDYTTRYAGINN
jgi:hypothetical protein